MIRSLSCFSGLELHILGHEDGASNLKSIHAQTLLLRDDLIHENVSSSMGFWAIVDELARLCHLVHHSRDESDVLLLC